MQLVNFISDLVINEVPRVNRDEVQYHCFSPKFAPISPDDGLLLEDTVETRVVPVHTLSKRTNGQTVSTYIAYSKEVQELLVMPFDVMKEEIDALRAIAVRLRGELADVKAHPFRESWRTIKEWFK